MADSSAVANDTARPMTDAPREVGDLQVAYVTPRDLFLVVDGKRQGAASLTGGKDEGYVRLEDVTLKLGFTTKSGQCYSKESAAQAKILCLRNLPVSFKVYNTIFLEPRLDLMPPIV